MLSIRLWNIPRVSKELERKLHQETIAAALAIKELGVEKGSVICNTAAYADERTDPTLIVVDVVYKFEKPHHLDAVKQMLTSAIGKVVHKQFPRIRVDCRMEPTHRGQGFWTSKGCSK